MAERKFEIAAGAVYVDVPRIEYVGERLQDRPELEFVIVVFDIFCDFCANALDLDGNCIIIGFAGHRDLYQSDVFLEEIVHIYIIILLYVVRDFRVFLSFESVFAAGLVFVLPCAAGFRYQLGSRVFVQALVEIIV